MADANRPIAVIGAGFSGTVTALHLLRQAPTRRVLLCERGPTFARGAAYSTSDPVHLLNVRAGNMSAFPDQPGHFEAWLDAEPDLPAGHVHETPAGRFVSRAIYGRYLSALVQDELGGPDGASRLRIVPDEVVALDRRQDGGFALALAGGRTHEVAGAVLAVGNLLASAHDEPGPVVHEPWAVRFADGLSDERPVVIVGTGLTMVDIATSLHRSGFAGPILAISRRGLLPHRHVAPRPWRLSQFDPDAEALPLSRLVRAVRREAAAAIAAGLPWQSAMDALRPVTGILWRRMTPGAQRSFVRHLRPWWDSHRHRMAKPVADTLQTLLGSGALRIAAGHLRPLETRDDGSVVVRWRPRGGTGEESVSAQRVIYATGAPAVAAARDTLLDGLIRAGLVRIDRHGLGLEATDDFSIVGQDGRPVEGLWAIGPILRGSFWECTAVPDIRVDAERVARSIGRDIRYAADRARAAAAC